MRARNSSNGLEPSDPNKPLLIPHPPVAPLVVTAPVPLRTPVLLRTTALPGITDPTHSDVQVNEKLRLASILRDFMSVYSCSAASGAGITRRAQHQLRRRRGEAALARCHSKRLLTGRRADGTWPGDYACAVTNSRQECSGSNPSTSLARS